MLNLDFTKFKTPIKVHDYCTVTSVSTGAFPRYIEVRMAGDDGALRTAIWDGSLNLAVDDVVVCHEYPGSAVMRVNSMGGADSGAGLVRVSDVWQSDFGAEALQADASGNITIAGTGTLTIPTDIIHAGDTDNKISFTDDVQTFTVGGVQLLQLTEAAQDVITLGAGSGDIDIDFNGDGFLDGSTGNWGFGTATPGTDRVAYQGDSGANLAVGFYTGDGDGTDFVSLVMYGVGTPGSIANRERLILQYNQAAPNFRIQSEAQGTGTLRPINFETEGNADQLVIETDGTVGVGAAPTSGKLDVQQTSTTAAISVLRLRQADVDEDFIRFDGTAASADLTRSIVDNGDVATATLQGWLKVFVNDIGNQITDQDYFIPIYTLA